MTRVAYFVSPHGFGHAARASAVMTEIRRLRPGVRFDVLTEVPEWFFSDSVSGGLAYHPFDCDVGLVQLSPLVEDLEATVERLEAAWSDPTRIDRLAEVLGSLEAELVIADISPLGLAAAAAASLPAVLVENFTWDWIYRSYPGAPQGMTAHAHRLEQIFSAVDLRIQTEPVCQHVPSALTVPPVSRSPHQDAAAVRQRLRVPEGEPMILISMGGVRWDPSRLRLVECEEGPWIVVPGGSEEGLRRRGRVVLLPFHTEFHHPDLVGAADVVVGKLGYSTVAEVFCAGTAIAFIQRPHFPESPILAAWVEEHMAARCLSEEALLDGSWLSLIAGLVPDRGQIPPTPRGAETAARLIIEGFPAVFG